MARLAMMIGLVAAMCVACSAFVPVPVGTTVAQRSTPCMSLGGPRKGTSPFSKAGRIVGKIFFGRPTGKLGGHSGGGGMMGNNGGGGGNMGGFNLNQGFEDENFSPLALAGAMTTLSGVWDAYEEALAANPILVKACTSFVGFSLGDTLAQKFVSKDPKFDYARLARMAMFGILFHGTISHFFYNALDEALPGTAPLTVVKKVVIDQILWAPIFTILYFVWLGVSSLKSPSVIAETLFKDVQKGVVGSWSVWPFAHLINFAVVPTRQRLLYINSIQVAYNVFLSVIGNKK